MTEDRIPSFDELNQMMETNPWWKEISDELDRVYRGHQLKGVIPDGQKIEVINVMFEHILISKGNLEEAQSDVIFLEAKAIIEGLNEGDAFPERLIELYNMKIPQALHTINETVLSLIPLLSDKVIQMEVERLWTSDRSALKSLDIDDLPSNLNIHASDDRYILRSVVELQLLDETICDPNYYPFGSEVYFPAWVDDSQPEEVKVSVGSTGERIKYLAYRVYDPLWNYQMERFEPEYVRFPLKWIGPILSQHSLTQLYEQYKSGKDIMSAFISLYQEGDRLSRLKNAIASCPVTRDYGPLFAEAVDNFSDARFRVCSTSLLPMIEGIIWEFAWWWHGVHGGLLDRPIDHSMYNSGNQYRLLKKDGTLVKDRPNIGKLLRQTKFGEEVYFEVVEYLVGELFEERNHVLHGRKPNYGNRKKAAALLFVVETLERQITKAMKEEVGKNLLNLYLKEAIVKTDS